MCVCVTIALLTLFFNWSWFWFLNNRLCHSIAWLSYIMRRSTLWVRFDVPSNPSFQRTLEALNLLARNSRFGYGAKTLWIVYFDRIYASFLELFKSLYPNQSIRPKMHFGAHFSTIVRKNGPMRTFWAMNYERPNGNFKQPTHVMNNYRNVLLTLAK